MPRGDTQDSKCQKLDNYFRKNQGVASGRLPVPVPSGVKRKSVAQRSTRENITQYLLPSKVTLFSLLKGTSLQQILANCPRVAQFCRSFLKQAQISKEMTQSLLKKYFAGNDYSLWCDKYAPKSIEDLPTTQSAQKLRMWITSFFRYRNTLNEQSNSMFSSLEVSCSLHERANQEGWKCKALILRGRSGVGKYATIRAVAASMRLEVLVCGNDYNQIRYLREKNESTKSESVQGMSNRTKVKSLNQNLKASSNSTGCSSTKLLETATPKARKQSSKNQMQGIKSNNHITGYFLKCEPMHRETTTKDTLEVDSKKLQLMRNIETFQPENQTSRFYLELSKSIESSKIPFILTSDTQKIPKDFNNYDVIEFQQGNQDQIARILWAIVHIERLLHISRYSLIDKEKLFEDINTQLSSCQFQVICSVEYIRDILAIFNGRLDYVFTHLQYRLQPRHPKSGTMPRGKVSKVNWLQLQARSLIPHINSDTLLSESRYLTSSDAQQKKQLDNYLASTQSEDNFDQQKHLKDSADSQQEEEQIINTSQILHNVCQKLSLQVLADQISSKFTDNQYITGTMSFNIFNQLTDKYIDVSAHRGAKKRIAVDLNMALALAHEEPSSLKPKELCHLHMLLPQKRNNRKSRLSTEEQLRKNIGDRQVDYLLRYSQCEFN